MTLSEMRRILDERGWQLTRSLGQNFLHDGNQVRRIVAAAGLEASDRVLEVGPGLGPLTGRLLAVAGRVVAVEKDARMVEALRARMQGLPGGERLAVVHADALEWLREGAWDGLGWKVVSNLPYSVGSPILVELAMAARGPGRIVVTLQEEVIDRLSARAGTGEYGVLTLLVGLRFQVREVFRVPRDCFFPAPDVESACAVLERRDATGLPEAAVETYVRLVKAGFGQRRKMLAKLASAVWGRDRVAEAMHAARVGLTDRAEVVTREQFVQMAAMLAGGAGPGMAGADPAHDGG
ncbi:MAG: 16S rRNA (adenine(1518)-N(6)/adenine(1519)-N(6))-dimethyltransferase RsmA [Verrucomicrobiota bacterium]|jgi:16S rRNA (adenine1518-N6/adenine1519-N6)-dimethyltransferase